MKTFDWKRWLWLSFIFIGCGVTIYAITMGLISFHNDKLYVKQMREKYSKPMPYNTEAPMAVKTYEYHGEGNRRYSIPVYTFFHNYDYLDISWGEDRLNFYGKDNNMVLSIGNMSKAYYIEPNPNYKGGKQ